MFVCRVNLLTVVKKLVAIGVLVVCAVAPSATISPLTSFSCLCKITCLHYHTHQYMNTFMLLLHMGNFGDIECPRVQWPESSVPNIYIMGEELTRNR